IIGAPNIVLFDAFSYFLFAFTLVGIHPTIAPVSASSSAPSAYRLSDAVRLLVSNPVLLSTTLMFMAFNLGFGVLQVWLPILADQILGGGAELYGILLGAMALGEVTSSVLVGAFRNPLSLGKSICAAQILSGLALGLFLLGVSVPGATISLA